MGLLEDLDMMELLDYQVHLDQQELKDLLVLREIEDLRVQGD